MKVHVSRTSAVVVIMMLIITSSWTMVLQPSENIINELSEEESHLDPDPSVNRPTRAGTPWPMHRNNPIHTAYTPDSGPITDEVLWVNYPLGKTLGSPAVVDDKVFIGSGNGMNAFYIENGSLAWRTPTYNVVPGGYGLTSAPAYSNGFIYFGGDGFYCLYENNGTVKWFVDTPHQNWGDGTPTVANGKVFIPGSDRKLYCLDEDDGTIIWTFQTGSGGSANYGLYAAPAVVNGFVYLAACDWILYQINETQPTITASAYNTFTMNYASYSTPVVVNNRVFVGCGYTGTSTNNRFYCLDANDLSFIWEFYPGSSTSFFSSAGYYNNRVYIGSLDGNLYCLDATSPSANVLWQYYIGPTWCSPAITNDRLYIGSRSNVFYCFNLSQTSGSEEYYWIFNALDQVNSSPAVMDGRVYVGFGWEDSSNGGVYCFGPPPVPPSVDSIQIEDQPGGIGNPILDQTIDVGVQITGYAAAYNGTDYLYDIEVEWMVANGSGANASTSPTNSVDSSDFYSGFFGGTATWTADDGLGHIYQVEFTIRDPAVEYISIVDTENIGSSEIMDQIVDVGFTKKGYAASFNITTGYMGDVIVNWSVQNTTSSAFTSPSQATNSTFNASLLGGIATWIADDGKGHTDEVEFTIRDPTVDDILIVDTEGIGSSEITGKTVDVGYTIVGYAAGFNDTAGYIGDVPVNWYVVNTSGAEGFTSPTSGPNSILNVSFKNGTVEWIADYGGGHTDSVVFSVRKPTVDYIIIRTGSKGTGSWVGDSTYIFGTTDTFYAGGYNNTAGWIEDVDAEWESDNQPVGNVSMGPSNSTTFSAINNGTCNITATYDKFSNTTGVISVINYTIDYIIIRDSPGGEGSVVEDMNFAVGGTATFYAAAYNESSGYLGDVGVEWESSNETIAIVTSPGISTLFTAQFIGGECNVTATYDSLISNVTGTLTVLDAEINYILITNAPNGDEISTVYLNVNETITVYASSYNESTSLYLGLVEVNWDQFPAIGSFNLPTGSSTTFRAGMSGGTTSINATYTSLGLWDNFTLVINDPTVDYIQIRDESGGLGDVISQASFTLGDIVSDTYYCAGYNYTADYIDDMSANWVVIGNIGTVIPSSGTSTQFTATTAGSGEITASYNGKSTSADITIYPEPDLTPPAAPTGLRVRQVATGGALSLTWNPNTDADLAGYNIYRSTTNGTGYEKVNTELVTETQFPNTGLINGVTYYFYITAVDDAPTPNESPPSDTVDNVCDVDTDGDGVYDNNDDDDDNDGLSDSEEADIQTDPKNPDTDGDGYNDAEDEAPLDPHKHQKEDPPPDAPTGLVVTPLSSGDALNISWDANTEEDLAGYNLFRSLLPDREFERLNNDVITSEYYVDSSLTSGVKYYYYVVAVDTTSQISDPSEKISGVPDIDTDSDGKLNYEDDDDDNDGLTDSEEEDMGTDPLREDSDGDGYIDSEDFYPLNAGKWEKSKEEDFNVLLLLIPIILIVILLLFFILTKKRKPEEVPPPISAPERVLPPPPAGYVQKKETPVIEQKEMPLPQEEEESPLPDDEEFPTPEDKKELLSPEDEEEPFDEDALPPPDD
ncbi:MAG: PQQ-binding-like beta-propeller repeat protein [Thermoplasmata archaeon]|nr:MAG: PQQ-binding-like beta-propeller repeat protein [Thermoplasmata archaeon]